MWTNAIESLFRHVCLFLQELAAKDAEVLSQEEQEKPVPPEKINEDEAREKIKQKALEMRRKPGNVVLGSECVLAG